jgi:DHA1 family bicyclomycin/chloramphenicol resistance-like MFS transporter
MSTRILLLEARNLMGSNKNFMAGSSETGAVPAPAQHSTPRASTRSRAFLLMLVAAAAVSPLAINLYLPSMPGMAVALGVDYAAVQFTLSVYLAAVALGQLLIGPISDRYGRRPVLLCGLVLYIVGSLVCMLAPTIGVLNMGRVIQAIGGCAGLALSRAIVRDIYTKDEAASMIGYVTMGMAVAPMIAPTIGGVLEAAYDWRASFAFLALFGMLILMVVYRLQHETNPYRGSAGGMNRVVKGYAALFRARAFWGYALTAGFTSSAFFSFVSGAAYVVIGLMGRTPLEYGLYFGLVSIGYMMGNFSSGRYAAKLGPSRMIRLGCSVAATAVLSMAILHGLFPMAPLALFLPMLFVGVGNGLVLPSCLAGAVSVKPEVAGAASGLAGSLQIGCGATIAPVVGALVQSYDSAWPMLIVSGVSVCLATLTIRLVK